MKHLKHNLRYPARWAFSVQVFIIICSYTTIVFDPNNTRVRGIW